MRGRDALLGGDVGVCLYAVRGAAELRVFTVAALCGALNGGGVAELWLRSTPRVPAGVQLAP